MRNECSTCKGIARALERYGLYHAVAEEIKKRIESGADIYAVVIDLFNRYNEDYPIEEDHYIDHVLSTVISYATKCQYNSEKIDMLQMIMKNHDDGENDTL